MGENLPAVTSPFGTQFTPLVREPHTLGGGVVYRFRFENNYGASVVQHELSYGGRNGLWELAVLHFEGDVWELDYDTEITDDVLGWLEGSEVEPLLKQISELPAIAEIVED